MPKKITPELKTRAVRLVLDHRDEYSSITAAAQAESIFRNTSSTRRVVRLVMGYDDLDPPTFGHYRGMTTDVATGYRCPWPG